MTAWTGIVLESLEKYVQIHLSIHFIHRLINPETKIFEKALGLSWGTKNNENYKGQTYISIVQRIGQLWSGKHSILWVIA